MNPIYKFCINRPTVNLLDPTGVRPGFLDVNTGEISTSTVYGTSDYIPVTPGTSYKLCNKTNFTAADPAAACYYTEDKTFISGQYGFGTVPSNAAYVRVSMQNLASTYGVFASTVAAWSDYVSPIVYPVYKADLAKEYNKGQNEQFYRATLEGKLTFQGDDYAWILAQAFDFEYILTLYISYDAGYSWDEYWVGNFWKTDCEFNEDSQTAVVQPTVKDQYTDVLAGLEKEFNLIDLAPEIAIIKADKRPMIQAYIPGDSTVGCFLAGMSWEQECDVVTNEQALVETYKFALNASFTVINVTGNVSAPATFTKRYEANRFRPMTPGTTDFTSSAYTIRYYFNVGSGGYTQRWQIIRNSTSAVLWQWSASGTGTPPLQQLPFEVTLTPVSGSGASGNITLYVHDIPVYCRYVLDVDTLMSDNTSPIPDNDIVENNRNYRRVIGYSFPNCVFFNTNRSSTPTKWGLYQPGEYYQKPAGEYYNGEYFPISRREWGEVSVWFAFYAFDQISEEAGRKAYTIKNNYPLWSVIAVLLGQIAPGITHEATPAYSAFLYSSADPIAQATQKLFLTPKSNILTAGYDQPAQKAPITLRKVLDMLRDCFRCYWFIDDQNRFRIEHITWFMRGGTYVPRDPNNPNIAHDLTQEIVTRNGKPWAFARSQYKFDKPAMVERYEFGWMDEVTYLFEGFPIDITSKYVTPGNIQQTKIDQFTSDIDYMLLNPGACSKDGFALLGAAKPTKTVGVTPGQAVDVEAFEVVAGQQITFSFSQSMSYGCGIYINSPGTNRVIWYYEGEYTITVQTTGMLHIVAGEQNNKTQDLVCVSELLAIPYGSIRTQYSDHVLQNFFCSFVFFENSYYVFDMPAPHYRVNGESMTALGIKKLKTQGIRFPLLYDIDLNKLIKTTLGNGVIDKLSINLSSRNANATLKYDTE